MKRLVRYYKIGIVFLIVTLAFIQVSPAPPVPMVIVFTEDPIRTVDTRSAITFPIEITSQGDNQTEVLIEVTDYPEGWIPELSVSSVILDYEDKIKINFIITPPESGGNVIETITLEFTPRFVPEQDGDPEGTISTLELRVEIKESSTPGFEILFFIIAFGIVILFTRREYYRK